MVSKCETKFHPEYIAPFGPEFDRSQQWVNLDRKSRCSCKVGGNGAVTVKLALPLFSLASQQQCVACGAGLRPCSSLFPGRNWGSSLLRHRLSFWLDLRSDCSVLLTKSWRSPGMERKMTAAHRGTHEKRKTTLHLRMIAIFSCQRGHATERDLFVALKHKRAWFVDELTLAPS